MDRRAKQLRQAKRRQRERDREAGFELYQAKLPTPLARRLKAGLNHPDFRRLLENFLVTELVAIADYPQLQQLCWNLKVDYLTRADAFAIYERNWRLLDKEVMDQHEKEFIEHLVNDLGKGVVNV